ncbi:MAG: MFS transporter [Chlamydiae bacterium]|nr:MFS transporter [Chlamydiota bacterium]MBI3266023.1 MFS transporter [Chlamydiota bacterium]
MKKPSNPLITHFSQKKSHLLQILAWSFYDFANSAYSTLILTFTYSIYFKEIICGGKSHGDFLWGLSLALGYLLVALFSPILGAFSDQVGSRKKGLIFLTLLSIAATACLSLAKAGMIFKGISLFVVSFFGFGTSLVFYNALLLKISNSKNLGKISGFGWAFGYLGGIASLIFSYPWLSQNQFSKIFLFTALFFLIFSLPTFLFLKTEDVTTHNTFLQNFQKSLQALRQTRREFFKHRNLFKFLLSFFFYNDGLSTLITFSSLYARQTLHMSLKEISLLFIFLQITCFLGAFISGFWVDQIGARKTILRTLILWIGTLLGIYFTQSKLCFWILSMVAGLGLGSCQAASRSFVALATPSEKAGEFFGFFSIFTKFSSFLGPLLFGFISQFFGSQKPAVLSILAFFILGLVFLFRVEENQIETNIENRTRS